MDTGTLLSAYFLIVSTKSIVLCFFMLKFSKRPDSFVLKSGVFMASMISGLALSVMVPLTASICSLMVFPIGWLS